MPSGRGPRSCRACLVIYLPCEVCAQSFMSSELARDLVVVVCVCAVVICQ